MCRLLKEAMSAKSALMASTSVFCALMLCQPAFANAENRQNEKTENLQSNSVETEVEGEELDPVVVSATRVATPIKNVGSSITLITAEEIEQKQARNLAEALEGVPGLHLYDPVSSRNSKLRLRGYDSGRVLFLIDGVKLDNQASQMYDRPLTNLSANDIESIEVLRGEQSSLYGSDAIGGVISITTKSGKNSKKLFEGQAAVELGTNVDRELSGSAWGRYKDFYYKVSASGLASHGDDTQPDIDPDENDGHRNFNYNVKVGADLVKDYGYVDQLNLEASYNHVRAESEYDTSSAETDGFVLTSTQTSYLKADLDLFDGMLKNTFTVSSMDARVVSRSNRQTSTPSKYWGDLQRYEYMGVLTPIEDHRFVYGIQQERDHYRSHKDSPKALVNTGAFAEYGVDLFDKTLSLSASLRQEYHDTFGEHLTYRGTASYNLEATGTRFHTSYGTGFKAPTLVQRFYNANLRTEELNPEESRGYDFGVEQRLWDDRIVFDVTGFRTNMTDQIERKKVGSVTLYRNVASSRTMGVESSIDVELTDQVSFNTTYTYSQSRDNSTSMTMDDAPHHVASLRVNYDPVQVEGLSTWVKANAVGKSWNDTDSSREKQGGYTTWGVGGSYQITHAIKAHMRVDNLFDKDYEREAGYASAGIAGYAGLSVKF